MSALLLVALLVSAQKVEVNLPFVKIGVLNSNNNCFTEQCTDKWIKTFERHDIIQMDTAGDKIVEKRIGEVACLHIENGWVVAKCRFDATPPKGYVLRVHSSPIRYNVSNELQYNILEARIIRFLLVSEIKASRFE